MRLSTSFERSSGLVLTSTMILALARQASAQLTDIPDLASVTGATVGGGETTTQTQAATTGQTTAAGTTKANSQTTNGQSGTMTNTAQGITVTNAPSLTTGDTATGTTSFFHLSDIPTIAGAGIPTQSVPWTAGAPFMQKSNLPEGTVFICVGAILGFLGLAVLVWRGLVAWSLHRSVQRAAHSSYSGRSEKTVLHKQPPRPGLYTAGSNLSLDQLSRPLNTHNTQKPMTQKEAKHASNLFFSPTAGAGVHTGGGLGTPDRRPASSHLPAGYYASTSAHIPSTTQLNAGASHYSPSYGRPASHNFQPSPDGSPIMRGVGYTPTANSSMAAGIGSAVDSSSRLDLNVPGGNAAGGRAPSMYLEEMFDNHGNGPRERF